MDDTLKLISINCQGLQTVEKRKDVFNYLRAKHCIIYLLEDVDKVILYSPIFLFYSNFV